MGRYEFDPGHNAEVCLAHWEREIERENLCRVARGARKAEREGDRVREAGRPFRLVRRLALVLQTLR